jgi:hypothetical protein
MKLKNDVNTRKAKEEIIRLFEMKEKFSVMKKTFEEESKALETSIKNFMYANGNVDNITLRYQEKDEVNGPTVLKVLKVSPVKIKWLPEKLEKALGKERCSGLIEKTYIIEDMDGLIKYLKSCGVNPKKFKSFLRIDKKVNPDVLKQMDELGEISSDEVKGCYEATHVSSYLKIMLKQEEEV